LKKNFQKGGKNMKHKIGIIGAGMIAEKHLEGIAKNNRLESSWLADTDLKKLKAVGIKYQVPNTTLDYRDILNSKDVAAVIICTPPHLHKSMFVDAVKAGKHVFIEKPTAMNLQEIDEMITIKNAIPGAIVCDCSARHSRLQPKYVKVKEIIDSGALGEIYYVHHNSVWRNGRPGIEYHPEAKWFMNKAIAGGGPLFDWGVYDLSFHLGVLGDVHDLDAVNDVFLKSGLDDYDPGDLVYDVEEQFAAHLRLTGGIRFYWERGNHANVEVPNETRIYGTRGGLKFGFCSWDPPVINLYDYDDHGKSRHTEIPVQMEGHSDDQALIDHFAELLDGNAAPAMPLELVRKHLDIIWKCYKEVK
jgi:predicted dehydrogenase